MLPGKRHAVAALLARGPAALALAAVTLLPAAAAAQYGAANGEWRSYGGDLGSTKYSPLDQIDASNFADLRLAWRWTSADEALDLEAMSEGRPRFGFRMFQATPLMVGGVLYISTALHQVAAVDAATGETIWVHDPRAYLAGLPTHFYNSRGVAYWSDGDDERIFFGTNEAYLIALDAKTGEPVAEFGDDGRVDLMEGIPRAVRGATNHRGRNLMGVASPPIVARDVVVTPNIISDEAITQEAPPGWLKGIDARTGDVRWVFRTVPQGDDFGAETWGNESWRYSGNTNVWSMLTADEETGYLYLPTGTPTGDYWGGQRPGDNLFAESLVAVDIETGQRMWHFQAVHHGVWDYDFPAAPSLVDITVDGRPVKAIAQVSKQGFAYVFDRVTGDPVWPIEERPVETDTDLDGEVLSPTQPFPTKPPPFEYQGVTIDDLVDFTPEIRQMAIEAVARLPARPALHAADAERRRRSPGHHPAPPRRRRGRLGGLRRRPGDRPALRPVGQRLLGDQVLHARPGRRRQPAAHDARARGGRAAPHAERAAAAQAALHADDRHRPQPRRARLDAAERRRQPLPPPPAAARPRPPAPRRRRSRRGGW